MKPINKKILIGCGLGAITLCSLVLVPSVSASAMVGTDVDMVGEYPEANFNNLAFDLYAPCDISFGIVDFTDTIDINNVFESVKYCTSFLSIPRKVTYFNNNLYYNVENFSSNTSSEGPVSEFYYEVNYPVASNTHALGQYTIADNQQDVYDMYISINDMYLSNKYSRNQVKLTINRNYANGFDGSEDILRADASRISFSVFTLSSDNSMSVVSYSEDWNTKSIFSYGVTTSSGDFGVGMIDTYIYDNLIDSFPDAYGFYVHSLDIILPNYIRYGVVDLDLHYGNADYLSNIFGELTRFKFEQDDLDISEFLIGTVGSFMDFEIFPNFSFGILLSLILSLSLIVWIIKVFLGG